MAIHYQNFKAFSKGQGYAGAMCRSKFVTASTRRWFATDCMTCKLKLLNRRVVMLNGDDFGRVFEVYADRVLVARPGGDLLTVNYKDLDEKWGPADGGE